MVDYDSKTPRDWARDAAEAVRAINHLTIAPSEGRGYQWPSEVADTIAGLGAAAMRMSQALEQASSWVEGAHRRGLITDAALGRESTGATVARICGELALAQEFAGKLATVLARAHTAGSRLAGVDREETDEEVAP